MLLRGFVLLCLALAAAPLFAAPPSTAGPPAPAITVVDSLDNQVGTVVGEPKRPLLVKYSLAGGDSVLIEVTPFYLRTSFGNSVYFTSNDCTGSTAYIDSFNRLNNSQLTRRQAIVVNAGNDFTVTSSRLFVSAPDAPLTFYPSGLTVFSRASGGTGTCVTLPFPQTLDAAAVFTEVENLSAKFTPPFRVP